MKPYVTSLRPNAKRAHIGHPITACGVVFVGPHRTSENMPADRTLCRACVKQATGYGWITSDEADALLGREPNQPVGRAGADRLVPLLIEGRSDRDIAVRLGVSMRTVSRLVFDAMRTAGARTRFQWGYLVGSATR